MKTFIRILNYAQFQRRLLLLYALMSLLSIAFSMVNFTALIPVLEVLFDQVSPSNDTMDRSIKAIFYRELYTVIEVGGKRTALIYISLIILSSVFLSNLFRYLADLLMVRLRSDIIYGIRSSLFNKIIHFPLGFFTDRKKGDMISRVTTDIQEIETSIIFTLKVFLKEPILILGYAFILFSISTELALYTLILIPVSGILIASVARRLKKKALHSQEVLGDISFTVDESLTGLREIKSFNAQGFVKDQFDRIIKEYSLFSLSMGKRFQLAGPLSEFLGVSTMVLILILGGSMVLSQESSLTASQFIGFLIIFSQILAPSKALSQAYSLAQRGMAGAYRIFEVMDESTTDLAEIGEKDVHSFTNAIVFEQVSFAYENKWALEDVSFTFEKGKTYALVGPSGSGKTTFADLVLRFHHPQKGKITIDGVDLKEVKAEDLRNLISVVSQEVILFNDSIINNITLGKPVDQDALDKAIDLANAGEFIDQLPGGLHTVIGDRGSKLSGGQRQRIAIARALLKNAPILILDEATSALDAQTEGEIREAIDHLMKGRTSLIITHRLATIEHCDHIIVLNNGLITHFGSHKELLQDPGYYQETLANFYE